MEKEGSASSDVHKSKVVELSTVCSGEKSCYSCCSWTYGFYKAHAVFHLSKATCLPSNHLILVVQTKIWEPFLRSSIFNENDLRHCVLPAGDLVCLTSPIAWTCWQCCYGMWITLTLGFWNYSLEWGTLMTKYFLSSTQNTNAFCCFWNSVDNQLKGNVGQGLTEERSGEWDWRGCQEAAVGDHDSCKA